MTNKSERAVLQKEIAQRTVAEMNASGLWPGEVVTEISPLGDFWEAEAEHQAYLRHNPHGYTCHFERHDWILPEDRHDGA